MHAPFFIDVKGEEIDREDVKICDRSGRSHLIEEAGRIPIEIDRPAQGRGLGAELLIDALRRCPRLAESLGIFAVEVLALDDEARRFYRKYAFVPLADDERHFYLSMKTIEAELGGDAVEE